MQPQLSWTGRIATFSFQRKWLIIGVWLLVLAGSMAAAGAALSGALTNEQRDLTNSDSVQVLDTLEQRFGKQPFTETIVIRSEADTIDSPAFQALTTELGTKLAATEGVVSVVTPNDAPDGSMVSADKHAAIVMVALAGEGDADKADKYISGVLDTVNGVARPEGFAVNITGFASSSHEMNHIMEEDLMKAEQTGLPIALIVLVLAFGSLIAAFVPIMLGMAAIVPAIGAVALIGQVFELSFMVTNMITMIGLAVGIDYTLFIIGRYRDELARGHSPKIAMGIAADSSGRAVFFSGVTVLLALAGMLLVQNNIFVSLGIGAIVVTLFAVAASLTLLPAILGVLGRKVNSLRVPYLGKAGYGGKFWTKATNVVQRQPVIFAGLSIALLVAAALPLTTINLGANGIEAMPKDTQSYQAIMALQRDFAGGLNSPLWITVEGDSDGAGIARFKQAVDARGDLQWLDVRPSEDGSVQFVRVALTTFGVGDDAQRVVRQLRNDVIPQSFAGTNASVLVGGELASFVDVKAEMDGKMPVVFAFVLGLSFVLLLLVFRSVVIPAKAIVMNLLSVGAAYGLVVLVFQHGVGADLLGFSTTDQIEFWLPLFLFSILFGLSMDYHVFLLSRIKEEFSRSGNNTEAVAAGVRGTAGMITSAAVIMVAVFAAFASGSMVMLQQMGFGLAVAVFLDATVIRSVLVPASMQLLGRYNWWMPSWLGWLPELHVEGAHPTPAISMGGADD